MNSSGQERVIREVQTRDDMCCAECHLLRLGEKIVRVTVQYESSDRSYRHQLLGHDLGRVQDVEGKAVRVPLREHLNAKLVLRIGPCFDRLPQVSSVEIRIGA